MSTLSLDELLGTSPQDQTPEAIPTPASTSTLSLESLLGSETPVPEGGTNSLNLNELVGPTTSTGIGSPNLFEVQKEYGRPLVKEDIISDPRLMEVVYSSLEARYAPASMLGNMGSAAIGAAGGDIGGLSGRDYRSMEPEKAFEIYQNYQRSFAGGQTVTTANELVFGTRADDKTKAALGAGYLLFDSMDNAFTGDGSWSEMGDAIWDYGKAAVWDPSTLISFGIGKALSVPTSKLGAAALKSTMTAGYQASLKQGMTKTAAKAAVGAALKSAKYAIPDAAISVGSDIAYQMQLIETGAQENYSTMQSGVAALGGLVIPAMVGASSGVKSARAQSKWLKGTELDPSILTLSGQAGMDANAKVVRKDVLIDFVDSQFGEIKGDPNTWVKWKEAKAASRAGLEARDEFNVRTDAQNDFFQLLLLGDDTIGQKGYAHALQEAGFRVTETMRDELRPTGVFAQALEFLPDEKVAKLIDTFEKNTGMELGITKTAKGISDHFINNATSGAKSLWISSRLSDLSRNPSKGGEIIAALADEGIEEMADPKRAQFMLSVYKRLLTSSLSTTGTNIKGFGISTVYNTATDMAVGAINMGQAGYYKLLKGDVAQAEKYLNRSKGSVLGGLRRGVSAFSPDIEMEYAMAILELNPKVKSKLFMQIAGDGGEREALELYNLDKSGKLWSGVDAMTKGAQAITGGKLQDDITKTWAFGNNVDQAIMREYGVMPTDFFRRPDAALEMSTDRFKTDVLEKALFRTQKETASVNWNRLPASTTMRSIAKEISKASSHPVIGYILPFGNFMNTNLAALGDLTGINAIRFLNKRVMGKELDFVTEEGAEALGKAVVGWSAIAMAYHGVGQVLGAKDKVAQGYAFNQELNPDGSIEDIQYDGFNAGIRVIAQAVAHGLDGKPLSEMKSMNPQEFMARIPPDIWKQIAVQTGGQVVRDVDDVTRSVMSAGTALTEGNIGDLADVLYAFPARIIQGATRPLEPIDQVYGLFTDKNMNPDFRQGPNKLYEALRYIDNLTGASENLPVRATATEGRLKNVDFGKQILGVRGSTEPVLYERMLNAAGVSKWNAVKFQVPPEVKNTMDAMAAPLFEYHADQMLRTNPKWFSLSQDDKEKTINTIKEKVQKTVLEQMKGGAVPQSLELFRVLSGKNKNKVKTILEFMGEEPLEKILKRDDAYETLNKVQNMVDSYDQIFTPDFLR